MVDEGAQAQRRRRDARVEAMAVVSLASVLLMVAEWIHSDIPVRGALFAPALVCGITWVAMGVEWWVSRRPVTRRRCPDEPPRGLYHWYRAMAVTSLVLAVSMVWLPVAPARWFVDLVVLLTAAVPLAIEMRMRLHGW